MNLKERTKKLPWFAIVAFLCVLAASWQFAAIRKELKTLKTEVSQELKNVEKEVTLAKHNALAAVSSNNSDSRVSDLESKINNLESKVIGGYGLESRVDDLESKVSDMISHSH
ncbi:MAG: hypothetical protein ACYSUK_06535 [Planctomycetota bacterium]|jgi:Skp family chaperone for outer membrane proteins